MLSIRHGRLMCRAKQTALQSAIAQVTEEVDKSPTPDGESPLENFQQLHIEDEDEVEVDDVEVDDVEVDGSNFNDSDTFLQPASSSQSRALGEASNESYYPPGKGRV